MVIPDWRLSKPALALLVILAVAFPSAIFMAQPRTYIVTRTSEGFQPEMITVRKGDHIKFVNISGEPVWPASAAHPSHQIYPEFDSKQPIADGRSWIFTVARAGVWRYHDHLSPLTEGTITALGEPGESARNCVASATDTIKAYCWTGEVETILRTKGLSAVYDQFAKWHLEDPIFRRNCHDVGHVIGIEAYKAFKKNGQVITRPETAYCGYGFYHGFIEEALREIGTDSIKETIGYCEQIRASGDFDTKNAARNAAGACYHGIGHAVFDSLDPKLWGNEGAMVDSAMSTCLSHITGAWERSRCVSGVFNSLANALSANSYELAFDPADPIAVCKPLPTLYREPCILEVGIGFARNEKYSIPEAIDFLETERDPAIEYSAIRALMDDEVRRRIGEPDMPRFISLCTVLRNEEKSACIDGVVSGFFVGDIPGKGDTFLLGFCSALSDHDRVQCFRSAVGQFNGFKTPEKTRDFCLKIQEDIRSQIQYCTKLGL